MPKPVPNTQTGSLTDHQHGTNDTLILADAGMGGPPLQVVLYGEAFAMYDDSRGGNDTLIGGAGAINFLNDDVLSMYDHAYGGNDTLIGGDGAIFNFFLGDASDMYDSSRGGNDTLIGGANTDNELFGDAFTMHGNARGRHNPRSSATQA